MLGKKWVVYAYDLETGFLDFVSAHRTEWGASRTCEKKLIDSVKDYGHMGDKAVSYKYERSESWASRNGSKTMGLRKLT